MTKDKSLKRTFSELEAERERTWSSSALQVNRNQRRTLVEGFAERRHVAPGDVLGEASLVEVDAGKFVLADVLSQGPAVLIFFRFAGCPACNLALPHYERTLAAEVRFRGGFLVAISPQLPERLVEIKRRHGLSFAVASDPGNALAQRLGITYSFDEPSRQAALSKGQPIGDVTGTGTWELPMPAVLIVDRAAIVRFVDVSPDWLARTEFETVLDALDRLVPGDAGAQRRVA